MPKINISVAMCTFNGENFLKEQLESILAQTMRPSELVICDDCSNDGTLEIIDAFKERCNFSVILITNSENLGVNKNFENAIKHCSGEFIFLSDQDDIWHSTKIKEIISAFQDNPACGYVFSNANLVDKVGKSLGLDLWQSSRFTQKRYNIYSSGDQLKVMLRDGNFIYGMTMAFRSSYMSILLPIESQAYDCTHDTWIATILSGIGANGVAVPKLLVDYRQHEKQVAGGGRPLSFFQSFVRACTTKNKIDMVLVAALMNIAKRLRLEAKNNDRVSSSVRQLTERANHLRARYLADSNRGFKKFKIVFVESMTGRYGRYSGSIKSIVKDLF